MILNAWRQNTPGAQLLYAIPPGKDAGERREYPRLRKLWKMMKLTVLLLFTACLHIHAAGYGQQVTMSLKDARLETVIRSLKKQTGYAFFCDYALLEKARPVSIHVKNAPLPEALRQCFEHQPLTYSIVGKTVVIQPKAEKMPTAASAPLPALLPMEIVVKGKITNEKGEALPGVTIQVKGTSTGVITNENGEYIITVPDEKGVLLVSFVGYEKVEMPVGGKARIDIALKPANTGVNEVVVVGYGTQKKVTMTGAVSSMDVKSLVRSPAVQLSNSLAGQIPGIVTRQSSGEPGYDQASVWIRGLGTFTGSTAPLVLVDGIERDMNFVDPNDVESFSILKDASATAVYGVRGANGVILITTKGGKSGKPRVSLRVESAVNTPWRLPDFINGYEYALLANEARESVGQQAMFTETELQKFKDQSDPYLYPDVNWADEIFRKNTNQQHAYLSVNGGNNVIRYYVSLGYIMQGGIYREDPASKYETNASLKRYNFRSNLDVNLSKSFTVSLGTSGIIQRQHYPGSAASDIYNLALWRISPIAYPVRNPDGSISGVGQFYADNPWARLTQSGYDDKSQNWIQSNLVAKWDLSSLVTKGLSLRSTFSYDFYGYNDIFRPKTFGVKQYLGKDPSGADQYKVLREEKPLGYSLGNSANRTQYFDVSLNYSRSFGKHTVNAMALANAREALNLTAGNSVDGLPRRQLGIAGRLSYNFQERYLAEFNFGYNGSENFPAGQRFGFFPSISAGWIVSNEKFWTENNVISSLKLRGSHGQVGNDQLPGRRFLFLTKIVGGGGYGFGPGQQGWAGLQEGPIGTNNVTWEVATKSNIGVDVSMFNNRLTLQVDGFRERRENLLIARQTIPDIMGFLPGTAPYGNLGVAENKGVDAMLEFKGANKKGDLLYSFRSTFTYAHSTVVYNDQPKPKFPHLVQAGLPIGQQWMMVADGFYKDKADVDNSLPVDWMAKSSLRPGDVKFKDVNNDGKIDQYDVMPVGYPRTPEIVYGFGGTVAYKGIELSVYFSGAARTSLTFMGGDGRGAGAMTPFNLGIATGNVFKEYYENRWTPENSNAKYPRIWNGNNINNYYASTLWLRDASYLKLRNAEVAYSLPKHWVEKIGTSNIRVYVNGLNLLSFDKIRIIDPEANNGTGGYPISRTVNFGIQADF